MLKKLKKLNNQGFTIIEVLIVLAIAGLILLIVFLAVPALQRNSRNTQRRTEAARLLAVVQENINNNGGALPNSASGFVSTSCAGTGNAAGKCDYTTTPNIAMQIWQLGNLKNIDGFTVQPAGTVAVQTPVLTPATATEAILDTGVNCGALNAGQTAFTPTTTGATNRSLVLYYAIEDASGNPIAQCTSS